MTVENESNNEPVPKLFRRPKPSKLQKIDLTNIEEPDVESTSIISEEIPNRFSKIDYHKTPPLPSISNLPEQVSRKELGPSRILFNLKTSARTGDLYNMSFQKRSLAYSNMSKSIVKPFKSLGPDPLPSRPVKQLNLAHNCHARQTLYDELFYDEHYDHNHNSVNTGKENMFSLNDFLLNKNKKVKKTAVMNQFDQYEDYSDEYDMEEIDENDLDVENNIYISSDNYNKICKLLETRIQRERNSNSHNVLNLNFFFNLCLEYFCICFNSNRFKHSKFQRN
jgi:hypothetical protein